MNDDTTTGASSEEWGDFNKFREKVGPYSENNIRSAVKVAMSDRSKPPIYRRSPTDQRFTEYDLSRAAEIRAIIDGWAGIYPMA